ncbi:MAG: glycosyltransferase family 2 protein, partial [Gammaproteobacteria bacterium]
MPRPPVPKVSVMLSVFNRSEFLSQAIESLLNQSFADFELIVIDDCSTQMECLQVVRN